MQKINVIILGGSINSTIAETHIRSLLITRKFKIIGGVFSKKSNINIKTGIEYGLPKEKVFSSLENLFQKINDKIDFAIIITPPSVRYQYIKLLAKKGINIICEKPLSDNITEAKKIYNVVKKSKIYFALSFNYIFYPSIMEIKNNISKIGKIKYFVFEMAQQGFLLNKKKIKKWRLKDNEISTLNLDLGSHLISLLKFLFNKYPSKIKSNIIKSKKPNIVETVTSLVFYNNFSGHIWFTKSALGENNNLSIKIYGSKGSFKWTHDASEIIKFFNIEGENKTLERYSLNTKFLSDKKYFGYVAGHPAGFQDTFTNFYNILYKDFHGKSNQFEKRVLIKNLDGYKIMEVLSKI